MNKSYNEITKTCKLHDYVEFPSFRVEMWIGYEGIWECLWPAESTSYLPLTYKLNTI